MRPAKILVVEDENIVAMSLERKLRKLGYEVPAVVATGEEAVDAALNGRPDLVLMDIELRGGFDGIEAARRIRESLDVPVVYLTAYSDDATVRRAKDTEPLGYIRKPFDSKDLQITLEIALHKQKVDLALRRHERWLDVVMESLDEGVIATDPERRVSLMNAAAARMTGVPSAAAVGRPVDDVVELVDETDGRRLRGLVGENGWDVPPDRYDDRLVVVSGDDGRRTWVTARPVTIETPADGVVGHVLTLQDVSVQRSLTRRREELIERLRRAIANVRTLRGMIPICASCKKIRDDEGFWTQIELYLEQHSDAVFTHGICPECTEALEDAPFEGATEELEDELAGLDEPDDKS